MKGKIISIFLCLVMFFGITLTTCDNGDPLSFEEGDIEALFMRDYGQVNDDFFDSAMEEIINRLLNPPVIED